MAAPLGNKFAVGNPGGGRPSPYKPEFCAIARKMCELGATDEDLAEAFGVSDRTIQGWQVTHEDFSAAVAVGKAAVDDLVERRFYNRAIGYSFDSVKIMQYEGEPVIVPYREHVPPDTSAAIFWLKNRRRDKWRDRHDVDHGVQSENPLATFLDGLAGRGKTLQPVEEPEHSTVQRDQEANNDDEPGPKF